MWRNLVGKVKDAVRRPLFSLSNSSRSRSVWRSLSTTRNSCLVIPGCPEYQKSKLTTLTESPEIPVNTINSVSFHGRQLPPHLIPLDSIEGRDLFTQAHTKGLNSNFFSLITNFGSQSDVSLCGLASLSVVLNALKVDPQRTWRHPWRWFADEMLTCCPGSLEYIRKQGVTLPLFHQIATSQAEKSGRVFSVDTRYYDQSKYTEFIGELRISATRPDYHVVVSFSRQKLGQTGIGHFSPVAAFLPEKNLALVLDVARFKYPPYWVDAGELFEAMESVDTETGRSRGYSIISKG